MWVLGVCLEMKELKRKANISTLPHSLPGTHVYTTPTSWSYQFWFVCCRPGRLQVAIVLLLCLKYVQMVDQKKAAVHVWDCSLLVIAPMFSKRGMWNMIAQKRAKKKTFYILPQSFPDTPMHIHTTPTFWSHDFWFACYRPTGFQWWLYKLLTQRTSGGLCASVCTVFVSSRKLYVW